MSTLSVSNITSPTNTTPLILSSANSQAAFVRIEAANNDIVFGGSTKFLGSFSSALFYSNSINVAFDVANASFNTANTVSGALVSASFNTANAAFAVANTVAPAFNTANAAFASANNVAPQVTPAFQTANLAYALGNTISASINSNWTVTNTVYGVANTALPNTSSSTLAGTLTVSTSGVPQVINSTNSNTYKVALRDNGTTVGFFGGSSSTPFIVANSAVNTLFSVDNVGNFAVTGTMNVSSGINATTASPYIFNKPTPGGYQTVMRVGSANNGLFFTTDNAVISKGCFYNNAWIATAAFGNTLDFTNDGYIEYNTFAGATIGAAPTFTTYRLVHTGNFMNSKASVGYTYLPNNVLLQWGSQSVGPDRSTDYNFPITFPNNCFGFGVSGDWQDANGWIAAGGRPISSSQYRLYNVLPGNIGVWWIAIGY
jgi:hypothetical protein